MLDFDLEVGIHTQEESSAIARTTLTDHAPHGLLEPGGWVKCWHRSKTAPEDLQ